MKNKHLLFILILFTVNGLFAQDAKKSKYLKPTQYKESIKTSVSDKVRSYYSLDADEATLVSHSGPGIIRVLTRACFAPGAGDELSYTITYVVDGGEARTVSISDAERSKKATYLDGTRGVPGQLQDFEIKLGRGDHSIRFLLSSGEIAVAARYKFIPVKKKNIDWISYCPAQPSEPVDLISRESIYNYYRFSEENPLRIEIIGPTQLRIFTRLEHRYEMSGRAHYRVQITENEEVINTFRLSSVRSEITFYTHDHELVPGKASEFVIQVPEGKHVYEIMPLDKDKNTVLGRLLIPEADVKLGN